MRFSLLGIAACAMLCVPTVKAEKLTYFVDSTCDAKPKFRETVAEAMKMARMAVQRMTNGRDTDYQSVVARIMSREPVETGPAKTELVDMTRVQEILRSLGNDWEETKDRKPSDLRFHCDNNARWKQVYDEKQKEFRWVKRKDGMNVFVWHDPVNQMELNDIEPDCGSEDGKTAMIYLTPFPAKDHNSERCTVTLCDPTWDQSLAAQGYPWLLEDIDPLLDFSSIQPDLNVEDPEAAVDFFIAFPSTRILHEMVHFYGRTPKGEKIDDHAYLWKGVVGLSMAEARDNADSYTFLGIFAWLAGRGYTLPRIGKNTSLMEVFNDAIAAAGYLEYYDGVAAGTGPVKSETVLRRV